jgi:hypothetical protein
MYSSNNVKELERKVNAFLERLGDRVVDVQFSEGRDEYLMYATSIRLRGTSSTVERRVHIP